MKRHFDSLHANFAKTNEAQDILTNYKAMARKQRAQGKACKEMQPIKVVDQEIRRIKLVDQETRPKKKMRRYKNQPKAEHFFLGKPRRKPKKTLKQEMDAIPDNLLKLLKRGRGRRRKATAVDAQDVIDLLGDEPATKVDVIDSGDVDTKSIVSMSSKDIMKLLYDDSKKVVNEIATDELKVLPVAPKDEREDPAEVKERQATLKTTSMTLRSRSKLREPMKEFPKPSREQPNPKKKQQNPKKKNQKSISNMIRVSTQFRGVLNIYRCPSCASFVKKDRTTLCDFCLGIKVRGTSAKKDKIRKPPKVCKISKVETLAEVGQNIEWKSQLEPTEERLSPPLPVLERMDETISDVREDKKSHVTSFASMDVKDIMNLLDQEGDGPYVSLKEVVGKLSVDNK